MTVDEMLALCAQAPFVYLTVPCRNLPRGTHIRLLGTKGPLGRISTVKESPADDGYLVVACWESEQVTAFFDREIGPTAEGEA